MQAVAGGPDFKTIARKWHDLAERRLDYYTELYRSGRWQHYYTQDRFAMRMLDVIEAAKRWRALAGIPRAGTAGEPVAVGDLRAAGRKGQARRPIALGGMTVTRLLSAPKILSALQIAASRCCCRRRSAGRGAEAPRPTPHRRLRRKPQPTTTSPIRKTSSSARHLLTRDCARCHAVGRTGASPHAGAPAFRDLGKRYPIESLEEALGEGIMSGHPDMPEFNFDADQVGAIIDYLNSIQTR